MTKTDSSMGTPLRAVRGLGSAKGGTSDFFSGRVSGIANGVLTIPCLAVAIALAGADHGAFVSLIGNPFVAVAFILFIATGALHMKLGMQVIIEDYVHSEGWRIACVMANAFFCYAIGALCTFAVVMIALRG